MDRASKPFPSSICFISASWYTRLEGAPLGAPGTLKQTSSELALAARLSHQLLDDDFEELLRVGLARVDQPMAHGAPGLGVEHVREAEGPVSEDDQVAVLANEVDLVLMEDLLRESGGGKLDEGVELGFGLDAAAVLTRGDDRAGSEIEADGVARRSGERRFVVAFGGFSDRHFRRFLFRSTRRDG